MLGGIGPAEIGILILVALLVFVPKRLPEIGSGVGRGMREFKRGLLGSDRSDSGDDSAVPTSIQSNDSGAEGDRQRC
ncbi:MAG: twin-arginine translocase TatA/TatE family subunit [Actinobacteria bacterium]|nr:twin-arginine translocase TatA/TatE family subunit [Actinomycetota bacterium]